MLKINFQNQYRVQADHGMPESTFADHQSYLGPSLDGIEARGQGFYKVIDDDSILTEIQTYADEVRDQYEHFVICGIGGSALGPIALREALGNSFEHPKLHVLENIDPDFLSEALGHIELENALFLVVSKSGGTPETVAQYMLFRTALEEAGLDIKKHLVFVTDPEKSLLKDIGDRDGIRQFAIPPSVGGRFSVQTAVGLLPMALLGHDINHFIKGMRDMRDSFLNTNVDQNLPFQLACAQTVAYMKGKPQNIIMPYHTKLRQIGAWCVQLIAESTGKVAKNGEHVGITPVPSLGVTDQHSQVQLFAEGPNDKLVVFVGVQEFKHDLDIPVTEPGDKTEFMTGKTFKELLHAEQEATARALTENDRPNLTITLPKVDEYYLGQLMMLFEGATAFWGEFFEINAFDQPGVERGKVLTREILGQK